MPRKDALACVLFALLRYYLGQSSADDAQHIGQGQICKG